MKNNLMKKNFIWNIIGSTFSAFNSLFFMIIVTRLNGVDNAGIFTFAFSTACLLYVIGIYSGRVYQVTDDDKDISDSDYFHSKFVTCFIMLVVAILFCIFRKYNLIKALIIILLVIFKALEAFSEGMYAIIQENNELYKVGISLFTKAILGLILFLIADLLTNNLLVAISALILVNIVIIILYDFKNLTLLKFKIEKFNYKKIKKILLFGFSAFAFTFLTQYVNNAPRYAIDSTLSDNMQTIFGIIIMPSTVMVLLGQFIIHPFILSLKESLKKSKKEFCKLTIYLIVAIIVMGLEAGLMAYLLGIQVLNLIYNIKLDNYLNALMIVILGATIYEVTVILSTSLITMRSTLSQLIIFIIVSIFAFVVAPILVKRYLILGAVCSYAISMTLLLVLYIITFIFIVKRYKEVGD